MSARPAGGSEAGIESLAAAGTSGEIAEGGLGAGRPVAGRAAGIGVIGEVGAVGADRCGGEPALDGQERQVSIHGRLQAGCRLAQVRWRHARSACLASPSPGLLPRGLPTVMTDLSPRPAGLI